MTVVKVADYLRKREWKKYESIHSRLLAAGVPHDFEVQIGGFVYDLALPLEKLLVEFDGQYHRSRAQRKIDKRKDREASKRGWRVVRVSVDAGEPIPPAVLSAVGLAGNT